MGIAFVLAGVCAETAGQAIFKRSTHRVRDSDVAGKAIRRILKSWPLIVLGVLACLLDNILYTFGLQRLPLSLAYPLQSLELVTMAIASRLWLGETVNRRRWLAIGMILAGTILVSLDGPA